jgi:hypothetical protein
MTPAFEQFARSKGWSLLHKGETGEYRALNTQAGWLAWQAREVPQWLPIESAPKDHMPRLFLSSGAVVQAFRDVTDAYCVTHEFGWRQMNGKPTHWMPLPAAPQQPASVEGGR